MNLLAKYYQDKYHTNSLQQIDFTQILEKDDGSTMFFYHWKVAKNYSKLLFGFNRTSKTIKFIE